MQPDTATIQKVYYVWSNAPNGSSAMSFMSSLHFRSTEQWEWTANPENASVWVLDTGKSSWDEQAIGRLYEQCKRPPSAYFTKGTSNSSLAHLCGWKHVSRPVNFFAVNRWLEATLPALRKRSSGHLDFDLGAEEEARQPWKKQAFSLTQWPNMARYGANLQLTLLVGQLLVGSMLYKDACEMVQSSDDLDYMLGDALNAGLLQLHETNSASKIHQPSGYPVMMEPSSQTAPLEGGVLKKAVLPKRSGLVGRLLKRFSSIF